MDFDDAATYLVMSHAVERYQKRIFPGLSEEETRKIIKKMAQTGEIVLALNNHRYIKCENVLLPCQRVNENAYRVKTVLTWDMAQRRIEGLVRSVNKTEKKKNGESQ